MSPTRAAHWLSLAAAPAFAAMATASAAAGGSADMMLCSSMHGSPLLAGMTPMYALMSLFHAGPWLKLLARARG